MDNNFPTNYSLYDAAYGFDFPVEQYFLFTFNSIPSKYSTNSFYHESIKEYFIEKNFEVIASNFSTNKRDEESLAFLFIDRKKHIAIRLNGSQEKKNNLYQFDVMFNCKLGDINDLFNWEEIKTYERKKKKASINLIKSEMGHLDTQEYDIFIPDINLTLNYGESFVKIHNYIISRLNKDKDKGIVLFHGDPGTGKTSYIKYLTKLIKEKEILFIPPSMAEILSEPTIIPFLMDHRNSILVIEDAERVISDREGNGSQAGVSNILNLTDGILGDCLNIQVIATFNMKKEKIDPALLRKGRLISEHKFDKLTVDETNILLKKLNKDFVSDEGMILGDIYNLDEEIYRVTKNTSKIGFLNGK
jgi:energy-coupling factor transporter ATP-binding protein EcfA2